MVKPVDDRSFDIDVLGADIPVLVEFGASWCPPCRMLVQILEEIAAERAGSLLVVSIDVDANAATQARFGVMSLPTMLLFKAGEPLRQAVGLMPKGRLLQFVDEALATAA
ncbi:MAG TPA: thioredoxin domain-containing protein [Candidatus Saccharimonadales bacterium]|nr:thioredoxin domain-containing protein [Candidatus Saccharimonadales bacterium]